jgi:hypothetical protein
VVGDLRFKRISQEAPYIMYLMGLLENKFQEASASLQIYNHIYEVGVSTELTNRTACSSVTSEEFRQMRGRVR